MTPPPESVTDALDGRQIAQASPVLRCHDALPDPGAAVPENVQLVDCRDPRQRAAVQAQGGSAPITPGRDLVEDSLWNAWADARYSGTSDRRHGLDTKGRGTYVSLGADRRVSSDLVAGVSLSLEDNYSEGFGGGMRTESNGFNIGPYVALRVSPTWSLDASLGYGRIRNDNRVVVLSGSYDTDRYSASLNASGQYAVSETQVRPAVSVYYAYFRNEAYDLSGTVLGIPISLHAAKNNYDYGVTEASVEVNRVLKMSDGTTVVPYAEFGVHYEFIRPNGGEILTGSLASVSTSAWKGSLRMGFRALISRSTSIEFGAGYLSLGQNGLNQWEGKLFLSHSF